MPGYRTDQSHCNYNIKDSINLTEGRVYDPVEKNENDTETLFKEL